MLLIICLQAYAADSFGTLAVEHFGMLVGLIGNGHSPDIEHLQAMVPFLHGVVTGLKAHNQCAVPYEACCLLEILAHHNPALLTLAARQENVEFWKDLTEFLIPCAKKHWDGTACAILNVIASVGERCPATLVHLFESNKELGPCIATMLKTVYNSAPITSVVAILSALCTDPSEDRIDFALQGGLAKEMVATTFLEDYELDRGLTDMLVAFTEKCCAHGTAEQVEALLAAGAVAMLVDQLQLWGDDASIIFTALCALRSMLQRASDQPAVLRQRVEVFRAAKVESVLQGVSIGVQRKDVKRVEAVAGEVRRLMKSAK